MRDSSDALLGLLHPAWQALIASCLLVVTLLGVRQLARRGSTRMGHAVLVTGLLVLVVIVLGILIVSCSDPQGGRAGTEARSSG